MPISRCKIACMRKRCLLRHLIEIMQTPGKQVYNLEIEDSDKDTMLKLEKLMNFYEASWVVGKQIVDRHYKAES
jgi:hypothetical protein